MVMIRQVGRRRATAFAIALIGLTLASPARAAAPIRVGCSMSLTGGVAAIGRQILLSLQIWRDDVNARGGLLGRPVELVDYDEQSNPANVPAIYTKLIEVDKVDLLIGPYSTNMVVPAIATIMQSGKTTIGILANAANSRFHYKRYFSMLSSGPEPERSFSTGFLDLARAQGLKTIALVGADAEFAKNALAGAHANVRDIGFRVVYDATYPPATTDFAPVVRAIQATHPDIVYVAAYPPDTVGIVRAAAEIRLAPKMFGGALIGLLVTGIKAQLGPLMNGIVVQEIFLPAPTFLFPGTRTFLDAYAARAPAQKLDPLGYSFPPFGYAAGQVLAAAVSATHSLDHARLADYIRGHHFMTVVGDVAFGTDGEWATARTVFTQFQHVTGSGIEQFKDTAHEVIVWPDAYRTGTLIAPYAAARD